MALPDSEGGSSPRCLYTYLDSSALSLYLASIY